MSGTICPMRHEDLDQVMDIQRECYEDKYVESVESFRSKLEQSPESCLVVRDAREVLAYFFSVPCLKESLPSLNDRSFKVPPNPDCFYLHDMAIRKKARGAGLPESLFGAVEKIARKNGVACFRGFSVQGTVEKWKRQSFTVVTCMSAELREKLSGFGHDAYLIERTVT